MRPTRPPSVEMHSRSCIGYQSKGESDGKLCPGLSALVAFVSTMCDVPADFEYDRAYGPYSGMRHEDRLVSAFAYGLIRYNDDVGDATRALHYPLRRCVMESDWAGVASLLEGASDET